MQLKLKSAAIAVATAIALVSANPAFAANVPNSLTTTVLADQASLKTAVDRVQANMARVAQDVLNIQANQAGSNNAFMNMVYQASLVTNIARLSTDGAMMNAAVKKLQSSAAPLLSANNLAVQNASKKLGLAAQSNNTAAKAVAEAEFKNAAEKANADLQAIFGRVLPTVSAKMQASIKKVSNSALKLVDSNVTGN